MCQILTVSIDKSHTEGAFSRELDQVIFLQEKDNIFIINNVFQIYSKPTDSLSIFELRELDLDSILIESGEAIFKQGTGSDGEQLVSLLLLLVV